MLLQNRKGNKNLRNSLLLSLILHVVVIFVLGFSIMQSEQQKVRESIAIDMVNAVKNKDVSIPHRVIENRESVVNFDKQSEKLTMIKFKPREFKLSKTEFQKFDNTPNIVTLSSKFGTAVNQIKSRFDAPLPASSAIGVAIEKPGSGTGRTKIGNSGGTPIGLMGGAGILEVALYWIARDIINKNNCLFKHV